MNRAYEILETHKSKDMDAQCSILRHRKTGARVVLVSNDDENKVFYIGFRTPPKDSTGVAHIIEHTVLCGSEKFPLKDPFVELVKGSLNTFLNAMTYADKTVYPVASCNDKDFQNLMDVYLDAVFHPNIYKTEKIFRQEGWHYEMEKEDDELSINGVVYNEMKGAYSAPDDVFSREIMNSLFPDTTYSVDSGGEPEDIPNLTYEDYLEFHRTYYHPSNSYIYLYGNMDMEEKLDWIDREYLCKYDYLEVDSVIEKQRDFGEEKPVEIVKEYPITDAESMEDATFLSYNAGMPDNMDPEQYIAFQVLDYALCSAPGAPVKQALTAKGIGKEVSGYYDNGIMQPYFSITAKNANLSQKDEFLSTIREVLCEQVEKGIDRKSLQAALNIFEFRYREADMGSYPKGLIWGLQMLDTWLYDDAKPFLCVEAGDTYEALRAKVDTGYYEELVRDYLLNSKRSSVVILVPKKGLTAAKEKELADRLSAYKASLSKEELSKIVADTIALREYQEEEDSPEDIAKIPHLTREDLSRDIPKAVYEVRSCGDTPVVFHDIFTNKIAYMRFDFDMGSITKELYPYVGIMKAVLGLVDTKKHAYLDFGNEVNLISGGYGMSINTYTNAKKVDEYKVKFSVKIKAFYDNMKAAAQLMKEMIVESEFGDYDRIHEIISEMHARIQADAQSAGHKVAASRALSYFSETAKIMELTCGMDFQRLIEDLDENFEEKKEELVEKILQVMKLIFRPENLLVDITCQEDGYAYLPELIEEFRKDLYTDSVEGGSFEFVPEKRNEGYYSSGKVQYVCLAGSYIEKGLNYTGALRVMKSILNYEYLWMNIRVKGGAYGCMSSFPRTGECYLVSYRDPNLDKTVETFRNIPEYLRSFEADEETMTKYIIGTVSELDAPLTPSAKGSLGLTAYYCNISHADRLKWRGEVLDVTVEDIRLAADYLEAILSDDCICVVGNEEEIQKNENLFCHTENLVK